MIPEANDDIDDTATDGPASMEPMLAAVTPRTSDVRTDTLFDTADVIHIVRGHGS